MRALLVAWLLAGAAPLDWHVVLEEDGIQVAQQAVPGRSLPVFRAQGEFAAPLEDVLAVLFDIESQPSWLARCEETRVLETSSPGSAVFYLRLGMPWPVSDRDAVLTSETQRSPGRATIRFRGAGDARVAPVPGVVRMPRLQGHYALEAVDAGRTRVEYQVDVDPGGNLPDWLKVRAGRDAPWHTLNLLRKRVAARSGP